MVKKEKKETAKKETAVEEKVSKQNASDEEILDEYFEEDGVCMCPQCRIDLVEDDVELLWNDLWELEDDVYEISDTQDEMIEILADVATILDKFTSLYRMNRVNICMLYIISIVALVLGAVSLYFVLF